MSRENPRSTFFKSQAMALCALAILLLFSSCKDVGVPPERIIPPETKLDTTSHDFTFVVDTLGNGDNPSYLKDVAIINDTLIYAVGEMYKQGELQRYNLAVWNGSSWSIQAVPYNYQGQQFFHPMQGVFAFSASDIWFCGNGVIRWTGSGFVEMPVPASVWGPYQMNKMWGRGSEIYLVGDAGSIAHFDGSTWTKMTSGTTVDLRDVWGSPDGSTVWACGYSNDNSKSVLLRYDGMAWTEDWSRTGTTFSPPYGYNAPSIWGNNPFLVATTSGVYRRGISEKGTLISGSFQGFSYRIRGNTEYDVVLVTDYPTINHYNGVSWKQLNVPDVSHTLYSVAIKGNMIVAVGIDNSVFQPRALVYRGRRN